MQSIYTIYFNNGDEVTPLRYCNGYSHAEVLMNDVAAEFMKINYTGRPHRICKYEEGSTAETFKAQLYKDATFPEGIVFVQKKYEATVYEKTFTPGTIYGGTTATRYLGRIGVIAQQYEVAPHIKQQIETLQQQLQAQSTVIYQQEATIRRQEENIKRSDYLIARSDVDIAQLHDMLNRHMEEKKSAAAEINLLNTRIAKFEQELADALQTIKCLEEENSQLAGYSTPLAVTSVPDPGTAFPGVPEAPKRPLTEYGRKKAAIAPVLDELKDAVHNGSWRKSARLAKGLFAVQKVVVDKELDAMIEEINALVVNFSGEKVKVE